MKLLDWLLDGDPSISRLVRKQLLGESVPYADEGLIAKFLALYDTETGLWGGGLYGPKWVSTHYTMRELKALEVDPEHLFYQRALDLLLTGEWRAVDESPTPQYDVCVIAMVASLAAYGKSDDPRLFEIIHKLSEVQMPDGGWNCRCNSTSRPSTVSSFHTTLSVLEAYDDFTRCHPQYLSDVLEKQKREGEAYLLERHLLYGLRSGKIPDKRFLTAHYPPRWYYDYLRALLYFQTSGSPFDPRMTEALDRLRKQFGQNGYMLRGPQYSGKRHFPLEATRGGRINTLRALRVLKAYDAPFYQSVLENRVRPQQVGGFS